MFFLFLFIGCGNTSNCYKDYSEKNNLYYFTGEILLPQPIVNTYRMRDFLSDDYFKNYKIKFGDKKAIDEIYNYALWLTDNDIAQSLFIITLATLPYKKTPAKIPILNFDIMFYFSLESEDNFKRRFDNIPSHFLIDSPLNYFGDKDKLPHFFGSAFLSYISDTKLLSKYVGEMIEIGEAFFNLEGYYDERDTKMNKLGSEFGLDLVRNNLNNPSYYFEKWKK